jgi:hypothetical protein
VTAHLSPVFTQAVVVDAQGTAELAAQTASNAITAAVRRSLTHDSPVGTRNPAVFCDSGA